MHWQQRYSFYLLAAITFIWSLWHQLSAELADPDAFYHMKMAQLIWQGIGHVPEFYWLPFTTLGQHFAEQHYLYHIVLGPFVTLLDPFVGVKLATVVLATVMVVVFAQLLRQFTPQWWWLGTVLLMVTTPFTFRLHLVKAAPLALTLLFCIMMALYQRRWGWLALTTIVYVLAYGGFVMLYAVVGIWCVAHMLGERSHIQWRMWGKRFGVTVGATSIGIGLHPSFPDNLYFYWEQIVQIGIVNYQSSIGVGAEWYPYPLPNVWLGALPLALAFALTLLWRIRHTKCWEETDWLALGLAVFSVALVAKSRRYIEYFGPFMVLACVLWWKHYTREQFFRWLEASSIWRVVSIGLGSALGILALVPIVLHATQSTIQDVRQGIPVTKYDQIGQWLEHNTTGHPLIIHSDWDDFPLLMYYFERGQYIAGLDPTFLYRADPERYWTWYNLTTGEDAVVLTDVLKVYPADYIIVEKDHAAMSRIVRAGPVQVVFSDEVGTIYQVIK